MAGSVYALYERLVAEGLREFARGGDKLKSFRERVLWELVEADSATLKERLGRAVKHFEELEGALEAAGLPYVAFDAEAVEPLLVGSSGGLGYMVFEVGLSWDIVYDLPVIPGSAVKGVARSVVEEAYGEELAGEVFGRSGEGGAVGPIVFFDAYPVRARGGLLEPDIVNPHYNPLTNSGLRTELDVNPVPVAHLRVKAGTVFRFVAAVERRFEGGRVKGAAERMGVGGGLGVLAYLLGAVLGAGVGGRTLKGYGRFRLAGGVKYYGGV